MISLLKRWFGKEQKPALPPRDVRALMLPLATPAIHVVRSTLPSRSHLGGGPELPVGESWPEYEGRRLDFLAQLSLPDLHAAHAIDWLPATGALLFFYDIDKQPWGFDPRHNGAARVLYVPHPLASPVNMTEHPAKMLHALPRLDVAFRKIEVFPPQERACVEALDLSDQESDYFSDAADAVFINRPQHQIGGYPAPIQGDAMELECQLVTNGLYVGNSAAYESETAEKLKPGANDWVLLLQFDTDDDLDVMWGDGGRLYYWVKKEAARAGDFSNTWAILQCT